MTQTIEITPEMADVGANEISQAITMKLQPFIQAATHGLGNIQGGGWRILSHSLTRVDRHLVLTLLIER
jgi:hypothetical protein